MQLNDKTIIVVGAAGNIGSCLVNRLLEVGANVVAIDSNHRVLQTLGGEVESSRMFTAVVDMVNEAKMTEIVNIAHSIFGGIDGAVNSAYPRNSNYGRQILDVQYADFCENTNLHLGGYFLFMQICARYSLTFNRQFSLVNLSSIYGSIAPKFDIYSDTKMTMPVEYAAIKAAIEHLTRYLNSYMKGRDAKFRVNCVSPGGILVDQDEKFLQKYSKHCLGKGMLDPDDVLGAIVFLLSKNSQYIAGQNIVIDDGFSV